MLLNLYETNLRNSRKTEKLSFAGRFRHFTKSQKLFKHRHQYRTKPDILLKTKSSYMLFNDTNKYYYIYIKTKK